MALSNIFYCIPEDNDDPNQMNHFIIQKALKDITIHDIQTYFPVPGDYHFRFQFKYQGNLVCLDLSNDKIALP